MGQGQAKKNKGDGPGQAAKPIQRAGVSPGRTGQYPDGEEGEDQPQRDRDKEKDAPGSEPEQKSPQARAAHQAEGNGHADQPQAAAQLFFRKGFLDDRRASGHHHRPAQGLAESGKNQEGEGWGVGAGQGTHAEDQQSGGVYPAPAQPVSKMAPEKEGGRDGEQVNHHHPLGVGERAVELLHDEGQGDVHHAAVQGGHEDAGGHDEEGGPFVCRGRHGRDLLPLERRAGFRAGGIGAG